jgi:hypothetical protein
MIYRCAKGKIIFDPAELDFFNAKSYKAGQPSIQQCLYIDDLGCSLSKADLECDATQHSEQKAEWGLPPRFFTEVGPAFWNGSGLFQAGNSS